MNAAQLEEKGTCDNYIKLISVRLETLNQMLAKSYVGAASNELRMINRLLLGIDMLLLRNDCSFPNLEKRLLACKTSADQVMQIYQTPEAKDVWPAAFKTLPGEASPPITKSTPTLSLLNSHLLEFKADFRVGLSPDGCVLLGKKTLFGRNSLISMRFCPVNDKYYRLHGESCPDGIDWDSWKEVVGVGASHEFALYNDEIEEREEVPNPNLPVILETSHVVIPEKTSFVSFELKPVEKRVEAKTGRLRGTLPGGRLVYHCKDLLLVYKGETQERQIRLPDERGLPDHFRSQTISITGDPRTGFMAVTAYCDERYGGSGSRLDVFNGDGSLMKRIALRYKPGYYHAVTSTDRYIIIAESSSLRLHVHNWAGVELKVVDVKDDLNCDMKKGEDKVLAVCAGDAGVLYLAAGTSSPRDDDHVRSLHAIEIG